MCQKWSESMSRSCNRMFVDFEFIHMTNAISRNHYFISFSFFSFFSFYQQQSWRLSWLWSSVNCGFILCRMIDFVRILIENSECWWLNFQCQSSIDMWNESWDWNMIYEFSFAIAFSFFFVSLFSSSLTFSNSSFWSLKID